MSWLWDYSRKFLWTFDRFLGNAVCVSLQVMFITVLYYSFNYRENPLQAPFFPQEAEKKGANATEYGLVFGIFELVVFVISPVYGQYLNRIGPKVSEPFVALIRNSAFIFEKRDSCRFCLIAAFSPPARRRFCSACSTVFQVTRCSSHWHSLSESLRRWGTRLSSRRASRSSPKNSRTQSAPPSPCLRHFSDWGSLWDQWWVSQFNYRLDIADCSSALLLMELNFCPLSVCRCFRLMFSIIKYWLGLFINSSRELSSWQIFLFPFPDELNCF